MKWLKKNVVRPWQFVFVFPLTRGQKALVLRTLILSLKLPGWTQIQNKTNINWFNLFNSTLKTHSSEIMVRDETNWWQGPHKIKFLPPCEGTRILKWTPRNHLTILPAAIIATAQHEMFDKLQYTSSFNKPQRLSWLSTQYTRVTHL